jgi:hypothetical protein
VLVASLRRVISIEPVPQREALGKARPSEAVVWYDLAHDCSAATSCWLFIDRILLQR